MKPTSPIKKFGIPILIIVVIGALVYFVTGGGKDSGDSASTKDLGGSGLRSTVTDTEIQTTTQTTSINTTSGAVGGTIVQLLQNIGSLTLPVEILDDAAFGMLSDGSVSLPPRNDPGRRNPFSALSGSGNATSTNPTAADSLINKMQSEIVQEAAVAPVVSEVVAPTTETKTTSPSTKTTTSGTSSTTTKTPSSTKKQN